MPFEKREYIGGQVLAADDMNNIMDGLGKVYEHFAKPTMSFNFNNYKTEKELINLLAEYGCVSASNNNAVVEVGKKDGKIANTSDGYVTFKATGTDPYIQFLRDMRSPTSGNMLDTAYIVIKYRVRPGEGVKTQDYRVFGKVPGEIYTCIGDKNGPVFSWGGSWYTYYLGLGNF